MRLKRKSFGVKLWLFFIGYAAVILTVLWLFQIVFLQNFYERMVIKNVERTAGQLTDNIDEANLEEQIDKLAVEQSLLIFLTDLQGNVIYSADEHNAVYQKNQNLKNENERSQNPHWDEEKLMNWQIGANRNLPQNYEEFLDRLIAEEGRHIGYSTEDRETYIYGSILTAANGEMVLYISTQLGAVGAAVNILRMQLVWITLLSLVLGFAVAWFLSRQFAKPVSAISRQAKHMAEGEATVEYENGFCRELDELSCILNETSAELNRLENARRELLANVSHDLRTPLTMIKGYAEMVRDFSWEEDECREEDLNIIINETDRLTRLVNDILEYSSVRAIDEEVEISEIDIGMTAQQVAEQFMPLCAHKDCKIRTEIEQGIKAEGNEELLRRVLYNLLDNAIRHCGSDGEVEIVVKRCGGAARAEVRDHGNGILQEELPHIWDRYFTSRQRGGQGNSGLGLAITKEILLKLQYDFGVESENGQGTVFWFEKNLV